MDSQPWRRQNERFDPHENIGYGPPNTMSIPARFTNRLPLQSADDDSPTSRATTTIATATQGTQTSTEKEEGTSTGTAGGADTSEDGSTYSSPLRIGSTTVELSTAPTTGAFTTPERASVASETSQTVNSKASSIQTSVPSTLQTAISAGSSGSLTDSSTTGLPTGIAPTGAHNTALPELTAAQKHSMSNGEVAAAVIMPILAAVAIFAAIFLCRRRRRNQNSPPPPFFPAMMEKMGHFRPRASSPSTISEPSTPIAAAAAARAAPTITNSSNNAYYTGLDTSSHGSRPSDSSSGQGYYAPRRSEGGTFTDPPPPYHDGKPPQLPAVDGAGFGAGLGFGAAASIAHLQPPEPAVRTRSPFEDPVSPLQEHERQLGADTALLSPVERPATSRSNTVSRAPSISSTQYSDTASVHSARAARMSVGGPQMIMSGSPPNQRASASPLQSRQTGGRDEEGEDVVTPTAARHRSVFDDPASPISSIASTEFHTLPGSRRGSVVSNLGDGR